MNAIILLAELRAVRSLWGPRPCNDSYLIKPHKHWPGVRREIKALCNKETFTSSTSIQTQRDTKAGVKEKQEQLDKLSRKTFCQERLALWKQRFRKGWEHMELTKMLKGGKKLHFWPEGQTQIA